MAVIQALFVPSGWYHSVENLEDTVSINHNWINGFNVAWSVMLLCSTFQQAVDLLCDCRCLTSSKVACLCPRIAAPFVGALPVHRLYPCVLAILHPALSDT